MYKQVVLVCTTSGKTGTSGSTQKIYIFLNFAHKTGNFSFALVGWEVVNRDFYTQYPKIHPLFWTRYFWREMDFDGFYGAILKQSSKDSEWYQDW